MVKSARAKTVIYIVIALLVLAAVLLSLKINSGSELSKLCRALNAYGYYFRPDDLTVAGGKANSCIAALVPADEDLTEAVSCSLAAGFPSRTDVYGDVVLFLAAIDDEAVITVYTLNGEIELCFIQHLSDGSLSALTENNDA